jgi:flagellar hook-length control protein FliK
MVAPPIIASPSNPVSSASEQTPNDEAITVSADANRKPFVERSDANSPVFSMPPAPTPAVQAPNSDSISNQATASSEATRPADTRPGPQDSNSLPDRFDDEQAVASERDHGSLPEQGQSGHPQQQDASASKGLFERIFDSSGSNSGQTGLSQNSITTIENLPPTASVSTDALPANVTVEAISIHSDSKSQETAHTSTQSEASLTPSPLPVLDNTDNSNGVIVDSSSFHSHASTSATGESPANGAAAQANAVRTDNPNFIAQRDRAMEQQIIAAIRAGHNEIRLSLYPAQLGQVTINMALDGQQVRVGMKTTNREATNVLLGDRQSLVTSLGHEGFTLDSFDVSDDQPHQQAPNDQTAPQSQAAVHQSTDDSFSLDITI